MKLLVYMRDGRTVYALTGRKQLRQLVGGDPAHEGESVLTIRGIWNPVTGTYTWLPGVRVRFVSVASIAFVEEGHPDSVQVQS